MQCQIRKMGEGSETARAPHDTLPRSGRVNEVCREWLVHEDGALAYRLQQEEVDQHLSGNKNRNAVVRQDTPIAKWEQKREEEEAMSRQIEERMMQEALDSNVAQKLAERLEREEERRRQARLQRDAEIARRYYEREHGAVNSAGLPPPSPTPPEYHMRQLEISASPYHVAASSIDEEEEARRLQEEKDAELARQLQEEEEGVPDRLLAIEAQDEELARMLQEKEKAKLRRAKERAKQKALLKKQQYQQHNDEDEENCYSLPHVAAESPTSVPLRTPAPKINKSRFPDPEAIEEILPSGDIVPVIPVSPSADSARNIAAVIDPTYPRKQSQSRLRDATTGPAVAVSPGLPTSPSTLPSMIPGFVETDMTPTPPYMPVQGQRRISSLEKKKKSKSKDACRQQ